MLSIVSIQRSTDTKFHLMRKLSISFQPFHLRNTKISISCGTDSSDSSDTKFHNNAWKLSITRDDLSVHTETVKKRKLTGLSAEVLCTSQGSSVFSPSLMRLAQNYSTGREQAVLNIVWSMLIKHIVLTEMKPSDKKQPFIYIQALILWIPGVMRQK